MTRIRFEGLRGPVSGRCCPFRSALSALMRSPVVWNAAKPSGYGLRSDAELRVRQRLAGGVVPGDLDVGDRAPAEEVQHQLTGLAGQSGDSGAARRTSS
jgi:hypothetical protein